MQDNNIENNKKIPMRELEKLTNLTRATINFYIKEGLLPIPHKSAKNMAYYDENFIDKLKYIEKLRSADFTLNQIKKLINFDTNTVNDFGMQVLESVNKLLPYNVEENPVGIEQIKEIGFTDNYINSLIEMSILISIDKPHTIFPAYSITICRFVKYYMDFGIPISVVKEILIKLKELVDVEKNAFVDYIRGPMVENQLSKEEQKKEVLKCIENINALLPILHLQFIKYSSENLQKYEKE